MTPTWTPKIVTIDRATRDRLAGEFPEAARVENPTYGEVLLSRTAWEKFCKFAPIPIAVGTVDGALRKLRSSFARACPTTFENKAEIVRRLIKSHFKEAEYLFDRHLELRYVVVPRKKDGLVPKEPILLTVEIPF